MSFKRQQMTSELSSPESKKSLNNLAFLILFLVFSTSVNTMAQKTEVQDTIRIANHEIEYEIIILETGFDSWLTTNAKPIHYYSEQFLKTKNRVYVANWNSRVLAFNRDLYNFQIDYDYGIDYGIEVNYILYNYFLFFEQKYNQNLAF